MKRASPTMRRARCLLVPIAALAMQGCAGRPHAAVAPPHATRAGVMDPAELYASIRHGEESIQALRTRFTAVVHRGDEVRRADGVLVVKKPDRFRLRLLSPFGLTVFDYVSAGNHARMTLPLEGKVFSDEEIASNAPFGPADLRPAFLRGDAAFPGQCVPRMVDAEAVIRCVDDSGAVLRETRIETQAQTIRQETSFTGDQARLITDFADYRVVASQALPFAITLTYPAQHVRLEITIRDYEVNPVLRDELFDSSGLADAHP